jgi:phage FluMu gp28-like protein
MDSHPCFFVTSVAGRQAGKTALAIQQGLFWGLNKPKQLVYWVSPTSSQATKVYNQMLEMIVGMPFVKSYKGSKADTEICLANGSKILFRSAAQEDSLRGETIEYLIIDEAAFIKQMVFSEILLPMLNVRGKKCLIISTPKGKNWFFHQYQKGYTGNKDYSSFKFISSDNPYSNPTIIGIAKDNLPAVLFGQEYLAQFVDNAAIFENIKELCVLPQMENPEVGRTYFMGIDIALKDDYTVITVIDDLDRVVAYYRFNHITAPQLKQNIIDCDNKWNPNTIMIERNNQGMPIIDDLVLTHGMNNIEGFDTTAKSKPMIINNLINAFASKKIKLPSDEIYISELEVFTMTISPTGAVKFAAALGFHDDIPMSLAIAWECKNRNEYSGQYNFN